MPSCRPSFSKMWSFLQASKLHPRAAYPFGFSICWAYLSAKCCRFSTNLRFTDRFGPFPWPWFSSFRFLSSDGRWCSWGCWFRFGSFPVDPGSICLNSRCVSISIWSFLRRMRSTRYFLFPPLWSYTGGIRFLTSDDSLSCHKSAWLKPFP